MTGIDKDQLSRQVEAFTAWKQAIAREISRYRGWLNNQGLNNREVDNRLANALKTLRFDRILLAFVGEFSRGKSELINAILGKHYGQRLLPTRIGRTTMCPTELFYDSSATGAYIKLLPIQTRGDNVPLSTYKGQLEHWVHLTINLDDPAALKKTFTEVSQTREVSLEAAAELGFQVEYLEPSLAKPGHVHIPAWRHALINIDHPLLRQGLAIIDTPGLNALGSEPELTLSLLPDAQALVFVLSPYAVYTHGWVGCIADLLWVGCALLLASCVQHTKRPLVAVFAAALLMAIALLAKEAAFAIPPLLALAWWFDGRKPKWLAPSRSMSGPRSPNVGWCPDWLTLLSATL